MKDTVTRVGRITKYVVVPSELITPVSQRAAGAVVKVTRLVGSGPVTRQTQRVRGGVAQLRVTRLRVPGRRGSAGEGSGAEGSPAAPGSARSAPPDPST